MKIFSAIPVFSSSALTLSLLLLWPRIAHGAENTASPNIDKPIGRGLEFLAIQQKEDGSFSDQGPNVAITGLGVLAFLASGNTPELGKYGSTLRSAIDYLLLKAPADGYFGKVDGSRMYGHAIATLALAEAWGVDQSESRRQRIRDVLVKSCRVIIDAQNISKPPQFAGGWRYEPQATDSDLSLSGWNALALRACRADGLEIPNDSSSRALAFILNCHRKEGGFGYQPQSGEISIASTGAAVVCLYLLNGSADQERLDGKKFLHAHPIEEQTRYHYYAAYYMAYAMVQADDPASAASLNQALEHLIKLQQPDGSFPQSKSGEEPGVIYATAMAVLTLEAPYRLLPVYQK